MQYKISFKKLLLIGAAVITAIFLFFPNLFIPTDPNPSDIKFSVNSALPEAVPSSGSEEFLKNPVNDNLAEAMRAIVSPDQIRMELPVSISIPVINVDAKIVQVGIKADGEMDIPKGPAEAAWFNLSPRPGESGNAIISGHYGWKDGIRAVFDDLNKLKSGDKISVEDEKGEVTHFIVREIRTYDPDSEAVGVFNSADGKAHLVLITCEGVWDRVGKTYSKRLAVFADKQ